MTNNAADGKVLHPKSRKVHQILRKNRKDSEKEKKKELRAKSQRGIARVYLWFQEQIKNKTASDTKMDTTDANNANNNNNNNSEAKPTRDRLTEEQMHELIEKYLSEKEAEAQKDKERKKGRTTTMDVLREDERKLYNSTGLVLPDLTIKRVFRQLRDWDGDANGIQAFTTKAFKNPNSMQNIWAQVEQQQQQQQQQQGGQNKKAAAARSKATNKSA